MTGLAEHVVEEDEALRRCPFSLNDPDTCTNMELIEVEREGDLEYFECDECGHVFGYRQTQENGGVRIEGNCQLGISEEVRRAGSAVPAEQFPKPKVSLGLTIPVGPPRG